VQEVRLTGTAVLVQRERWLELSGGRSASRLAPAGTRLADADGDHALLVGGGRVRRIDLRDGRVRILANGSFARLEGTRISLAAGRIVSVR
jgi:hypothetical protein